MMKKMKEITVAKYVKNKIYGKNRIVKVNDN